MPSSACDRCHALRSRCLTGPAGTCYRCYRLHYPCTYSRQRQRPGRKPRITSVAPSAEECGPISRVPISPSSSTKSTIETSSDERATTTTQNMDFMCLLRRESFVSRVSEYTAVEICKFFSLGASLGHEMSQLIRARVKEAPMLLLNPYAAVARVFLRCATNQPPCSDNDLSSCASALQALRHAQVTKAEHVGSFLSLGMSLVTFHRLISGISASTICRFTLSLGRPFYYAEELQESDMMELLCLVFLDTTQSLFRARVPVIQYRVRDPYLVDRHAGLCGPLLPLLYRVCLLAAAVRTGSELLAPPDHFDALRKEIIAWTPSISTATLERFSKEEMLLLITQANVHRTTAILILHRLRHPFGEQDGVAESLSQTIVTEMKHCLAMAGQYPPNITLVLLIAGAEVHDPDGRKQILSLIHGINGASFYPFITNLRLFLARVWASRDQGTARYLFRLFEEDPDLSIPL